MIEPYRQYFRDRDAANRKTLTDGIMQRKCIVVVSPIVANPFILLDYKGIDPKILESGSNVKTALTTSDNT